MKFKLYLTNLFFLIPLLLVAQNIKIKHGPYLQAMGEEEVTVVWTTNKRAISWVEVAADGTDSFYGEERTPFYDTKHGSRVVDSVHTVRIKGLKPGTTYRYRIFSKEMLGYEGHRIMYGNIASTDVYRNKPFSFTTLDKNKPETTFKVVNDVHNKSDMLNDMMKDVDRSNTDFVIFNGDMVSMVTDENVLFEGFMNSAVKQFAKEVPIFYARGNHETRGAFSHRFMDYFPTNSGKLYYTFKQGPVFFVVLDGGEDKPDTDIEYSELSQFDPYRSEQKEWLAKVVDTPEYKEAAYRVIIIHVPPLGSTWHGTRDIERKFMPILNKADVDIMFCGHTHRYEYIEPSAQSTFPILINDNKSCMDIKVDQKAMNISIKDVDGKETHKHVINKK